MRLANGGNIEAEVRQSVYSGPLSTRIFICRVPADMPDTPLHQTPSRPLGPWSNPSPFSAADTKIYRPHLVCTCRSDRRAAVTCRRGRILQRLNLSCRQSLDTLVAHGPTLPRQ
jgi:hypothetical protein